MNLSAQVFPGMTKPAGVQRSGLEGFNQQGPANNFEEGAQSENFANLMRERAVLEKKGALPANNHAAASANAGQAAINVGFFPRNGMFPAQPLPLEEASVDAQGYPEVEPDAENAEIALAVAPDDGLVEDAKLAKTIPLEVLDGETTDTDSLINDIQPDANGKTNGKETAQLLPTPQSQASAIMMGAVDTRTTTTAGAAQSLTSATIQSVADSPPRMFRAVPVAANMQSENAQANTGSQNALLAKNAKILELFANRPSASVPVSSQNAAVNNPLNALANNANATGGTHSATQPGLPLTGSVPINNLAINNNAQVPFMPMATVSSISGHLLMQVHPAVTERTSTVEGTMLSSSVQRVDKSIELQLVPRSLGVIDMKIVNQSGSIKITIETQTVEALRLIRAETSAMVETFKSAGLKLDEFTITQNSRLEQNTQGDRQQPAPNSSYQEEAANRDRQLKEQASRNPNAFNGSDTSINDDVLSKNSVETELAREGLYL